MRSKLRSRIVLTSLTLAVLISAAPTRAQNADLPRRERNPQLTLATYEVGDLVVAVPDYAAPPNGAASTSYVPTGGGFGGGGGGFGGGMGGGYDGGRGFDGRGGPGAEQVVLEASPFSVPALQRVITRVVLPDSWAVNGRGEGQIEAIGASLVVLNTNEVHELIGGLLADLRRGSGARRSVAIDARWLLLNSDELDRLDARESEVGAAPVVDQKFLDELTRRPTSLRGLTNCFSGQSVYLISGTRRNVVRSYIPVVGSVEPPVGREYSVVQLDDRKSPFMFVQDGGRGGYGGGGRSVGYQPVIETPNFGVLLKVRPTLMHNEKAAVIDLTSTITFPGVNQGSALDAPPPEGAAPSVDRLAIDTQELATTMRVPLGKPVLVGGMSYIAPDRNNAASADPTAARGEAAQETRQLYLVLAVR